MPDYNLAYQVICVPGGEAAASVTRLPTGEPVLVVYFDPVNMTIRAKPTPEGVRDLADFCRALAHEAGRLAEEIDPDGEPAPPEAHAPRHALVSNPYGESGGGH